MTNVHVAKLGAALKLLLANPDMLAALVNQEQPKAAKPKIKAQNVPQTKSARKAAFAAKVVEVFKAKGLDVTPNHDVLTYGKWKELGLEPKTGEKATFVKTKGMNGNGIPLFHSSQVEPLRNPA